MKKLLIILSSVCLLFACTQKESKSKKMELLKVSKNGHYLRYFDGNPFFWQGDTGWLLFTKLNRQEVLHYLDNREKKGFNVIQVMVLHNVSAKNIYGDSALENRNVAHPLVTKGNSFNNPKEYDFWDNVDYVIHEAEKRGIYIAMVPIWGGNVKAGYVDVTQAKAYAKFLANRYKNFPNVIWINGGDIPGSDSMAVWNAIGETLKKYDPNHLITFHPRGRTQSSMWFQNKQWLDFNMFQSGHRRYNQDDSKLDYGEDNWRYVQTDFNLKPTKPTLDGEPSYEGIPQGLHDTTQPYWNDADARRYAYWAVFAGACGHTYGDNAVMQFYNPKDNKPAFGAKEYWTKAINDPGAGEMVYLKNLMLSHPYFERVPDTTLVNSNTQGEKYNYEIATRGKDYAFIYTYNGRNIAVNMGKIEGKQVKASWYNPRNGQTSVIGQFANEGVHEFNPPGEVKDGNDWVLILDTAK